MNGPYAAAAPAYWRAGWRGILPLPARSKKHPPAGFTGATGTDPSYPDLQTWTDDREGAGNICLRMPPTIIGIDVDDYEGKTGGRTLADAETKWGPLPPTWRTTSRDDGTSGIRFYRVPEGLAWPHVVGDSVEIIRHAHRYALVWPSIHPEGRTYRWITPDGLKTTEIPDVDSLPPLPGTWIQGLTAGETATDVTRNSFDDLGAALWLMTRPGAQDALCARMSRAVTSAVDDLAKPALSAHDTACAATSRVIRLAAEGHRGIVPALTDIHRAFHTNITAPRRAGRRNQNVADAEWKNLVTSAVNLVTGNATTVASCDCDGALTALIVGDRAYDTVGTAALAPLPLTATGTDNQPPQEPAPAANRTSWYDIDLTAALTGENSHPPPSVLTRADGAHLFYRDRINGLLGESESGKTWVALLAVAQTLKAGQAVTYIDFEDTAGGIVGRLRALGADDDDFTRLAYIAPDEMLHAAASTDLRETLDRHKPTLIVLDGVNAAMTLLGLDLNSNTDATKFAQMLLSPLAATGACVVYVDHVPKSREARGKGGIGAQAKRAMTTGCALTVEIAEEFGRGMTGRVRLKVDKDRPGFVREMSIEAKHAGTVVLTSDKATGAVTMVIEKSGTVPAADRERASVALLMEQISAFVESNPGLSGKAVLAQIRGDRNRFTEALNNLIGGDWVRREGAGSASRLTCQRPYVMGGELADE